MNDRIEWNPIDKLGELQSFYAGLSFEIHRAGEDNEEYKYLNKNEVCITILNPYQEREMFIDLTDEFTLTYCAFHSHYFPDQNGYEEMLSDMQGILTNKICSAALYYGSEKNWLGSIIVDKSELSQPVERIFKFVLKNAEFKRKLKEYGGEAQFCFWNPTDDCIINISKG